MSSPLESLLIGRTLVGRYGVERPIGRGGMSVVYGAMDNRLDRPVALKVVSFPAELDDDEREMLRERLRREAAAAAKLSPHPNVVQVYDYGTDAELDLDFIAMELLPGMDLKQAMRERDFDVDDGLAILTAAARGLAAGHRSGIVHRDVKPGNIFLARGGDGDAEVVKILDFGIAKALDPGLDEDLTLHDRIPHSPAYASPEQLDPHHSLTAASDVYQLGLVAYELLAGVRPFTDPDRELIRGGEEVPLPSHGRWNAVPQHLRDAVGRALAISPAERFADAREFAEALQDGPDTATLAFGEATRTSPIAPPPVTAREPVAPSPPRPASGVARARGPLPVRTAAVAAGIGALALIAWMLMGRESPPEVAAVEAEQEGISNVEALHEEFRPLMIDAYRELREASSAEEGEEAAQAVQDAIYGLQAAWVDGDLDRLVAHYAERVDFRGDRASRDRIRAVRQETIDRFPQREITIPRLSIEFLEPGLARALVDRAWTFEGGDDVWEGAARDEMILRKTGDDWLVEEEREMESF